MSRPAVDVIVPFAGPPRELETLTARLASLRLGPDDDLLIVDNNAFPSTPSSGTVIHAPERPTPAYARNRGAERGSAEWLLFLDADVVPPPDLLDRYFARPPGRRTALLAGGVVDEEVPRTAPAPARYAYLRRLMSQDNTFRWGEWGFGQTANAACRRAAFEAVGGFREELRAAEDADLNFRLRRAGWEVERREEASVVHRNRQGWLEFARQRSQHGAGAAWLSAAYPGSFPPRRLPGLLWWAVRYSCRHLTVAARRRDRDRAVYAVLRPLELILLELGRHLSNERPPR